MKLAHTVDSNGFMLEPVFVDDNFTNTADTIVDSCSDGFYKPKWDATGKVWVEGLVYWTGTSTTSSGMATITANLNNPPKTPPASCTFTVLGQIYTQAVTNNEATLQLTLHPAIANQKIDVTVSADGCVDGVINVGGSDTSIPMKIVATTTPNTVSPVYRKDGEAYYANLIPTETLLANIGTALSHVTDTLYNIIVPLLQNAAYTPLSLTADQKSAVADIQALTFFTTLANAYPAGKPRQLQHASYVANNQTSNNYYQDYVNDLTSLGWT